MSSLVTQFEPLYVVDTHALIWYLTDERKLSSDIKRIFAAAERGDTLLVIPAIVVAEMYYANQKYKWFRDFASLYLQLKAQPYFRFLPFEPDHVIDFERDNAISEMHDRIIVGVAKRLNAPLLSVDPQIINAAILSVIW
jgi:PIN domain nuclease of toxin-antitoxin system